MNELRALQEGALLVRLDDHGVLRLQGADRIDFLHGQVANDVRGLSSGGSNEALLLNHRGHALAQMRVLRGDDSLDVVVAGGALPLVEQSLRSHIIFDQVTMEELPDQLVFTLQGPKAGRVLESLGVAALPEPGNFESSSLNGTQVTVVASRRSAAGGFDLLVHSSDADGLASALEAAAAVSGSAGTLELARVSAGIPSAGGEGGEGVLPQEAGLEPLISYRKGCYLGQEIMARIEARGKVRRQLAAVRIADVPVGGERDIQLAGRRVGRLGTVVRHPEIGLVALAVLRNDLESDAQLEVGGTSATVVELPLPDLA